MFNLGAPEVITIFLLALIVLGPQRLPDAAKQVGRFMSEMRRLSSGFQQELKSALDDDTEATARARGAAVNQPASTGPTPSSGGDPAPEPAPAAGRPRRAQPLRAPAKKPATPPR